MTRSKDVPITQSMLFEVRDDIMAGMNAIVHHMDSRFAEVHAKFDRVDVRFEEMEARFERIDARFEEMEARFKLVDARFEDMEADFKRIDARFEDTNARIDRNGERIAKLASQMHQTRLLVEEQNARNVFVLDGLTSLFDRQERIEKKIEAKQ